MKKIWKKLLGMVLCIALASGALMGCNSGQQAQEEVTIDVLMCWNGSTLQSGVDYTHNKIADIIAEKTGVRMNYLACTTSEIERLNLAFATGDVPDLVSAPFWGAHDGQTLVIKKAAKEGLLMPLNELLEKYGSEFSEAYTHRINADYRENDLEDPEFNGEHYVIPAGIPASDEDIINWCHNAYIRKDILEKMGVDPKSITSSDKLYELLKAIKARSSEFKDANGNDIIISGGWHGGYGWEALINSFVSQRNMFSSFKVEDGQVKLYENTDMKEQQILYMRKLISEGLFDVEAFTQSAAIAAEKMTTGKLAVVGSTYQLLKENLPNTLYREHPEMEYVPLGPIINADGEPYQNTGVRRTGETGSTVFFMSKDNKYPEETMKLLNYINSEEGRLLCRYGIEGEHYEMVDGQPRLTDEWLAKYKEDPKSLQQEGVNLYTSWLQQSGFQTWYGESDYGLSNDVDPRYELAKEYSPITFVDGIYSLNYVALKYPKWDEILTLIQTGDGGLMSKAMFAATEEEAKEYIRQAREVYERGGIKEFEAFMTEQVKNQQ